MKWKVEGEREDRRGSCLGLHSFAFAFAWTMKGKYFAAIDIHPEGPHSIKTNYERVLSHFKIQGLPPAEATSGPSPSPSLSPKPRPK